MLVDLRAQRKLARAKRDALRGRFGRERLDTLVRELVELHRLALEVGTIASVFGLEGTLRHAIRGDLCLEGWRWSHADEAAKEILGTVYGRLRVQRPPWAEGQPEWVISAGTLIERTRCAKCHKALPGNHWKFCSQGCAVAFHGRIARLHEKDEETAAKTVSRWI